jgi:hypothetical protein
MKSTNNCLSAALAELATHGIRDVQIAHGSKHPQLHFRINGGSTLHVFAVPGSASDWRSPENTRRDVKRLLRANGVDVERERPKPPERMPSRIELLERRVEILETELNVTKQRNGETS